jgi:hypothetical protein
VHQSPNTLGVHWERASLEFLGDHPIAIGRELFRDAHDRRAHTIVDLLDRVVVEAAAIDPQQFTEKMDVVLAAELFDELTFRFEG